MKAKKLSFQELMEAVLDQLKSQKYMDSTLTVYRRTYNRVHTFLIQHDTEVYTHELGKEYISCQNVCESTLVAYSCAIRRLDDYIEGKPYRCHHDNEKNESPEVFSNILSKYLHHCEEKGNKIVTILAKEHVCVSFLTYVYEEGCSDLSKMDLSIVTRGLLTFSNKDSYASIRQFLKYLYDIGIVENDFSGIVPRFRRSIPVPTTYTPEEISSVEKSINIDSNAGRRNLAITLIASRMGLRAGDIAKLKLSEVNLDTGYISIIQEKTGTPLSLQMPSEVSESIKMHLENDKYAQIDGYVFHSMTAPYGPITTSIIRHLLNKGFNTAGVNTGGKKHGPHSFRSSLASSMVNDGVSYEIVRRILGHSDPDVIKHYAKADIENLRLCSIEPPAPSGLFYEYLSGKEVSCHV